MLSRSEIEDFHNALEKRGLSEDQFDVSVQAARLGVAYSSESVIVRHIASRVTRKYSAGQWVLDFTRDLDAHLF